MGVASGKTGKGHGAFCGRRATHDGMTVERRIGDRLHYEDARSSALHEATCQSRSG